MDIRPIHTEADYKAALKEISALMESDPDLGTPEGDRLDILATLVQAYEAKHFPVDPACNPGVRNRRHPRACQAARAAVRDLVAARTRPDPDAALRAVAAEVRRAPEHRRAEPEPTQVLS